MSKKYVITSCPAFMTPSYCKDKCSYSVVNERDGELTYKFEFDEDSKCQDCTDCKLKQIVELCKGVENIENVETLYDAAQSGMFLQANRILKLLDIQEVE